MASYAFTKRSFRILSFCSDCCDTHYYERNNFDATFPDCIKIELGKFL